MTGRTRNNRRKRLTRGYEMIADDLRGKIESGELVEGDRLPTKAELMATYDVSLSTVDHAIRVLRDEGLARPHQGRGTYVTAPEPEPEPSAPSYETLVKAIAVLAGTVDDIGARLERLERQRDADRIRALAAEQDESGKD